MLPWDLRHVRFVDNVNERDLDLFNNAINECNKVHLQNYNEQSIRSKTTVSDKDFKCGDCVWAKYSEHPWWPARIESSSIKQNDKILVEWFGGVAVKRSVIHGRHGIHQNISNDKNKNRRECRSENVLPWDLSHHRFVNVNEHDLEFFNSAVNECNQAHLQNCDQRKRTKSRPERVSKEKRECKSKKNSPSNLKTGEKPFVCNYGDCKTRFASKSLFNDHIKRHIGDKS